MSRKHRTLLIGAAVVLTAAVLAVQYIRPPRKGTWARIQREGLIRIGYSVEAPYVFLDDRGDLTGIEVDVARAVMERAGVPRIEWVQANVGSLLSELEAGRSDAISSLYITPERARRVAFSEPTFRARQALLVRAGNPHRFHSYDDLLKSDARIAVLHGAIEEGMVLEMGFPESRVVETPDVLTGRIALETGLVEALALSEPAALFMTRRQMLGLTEIAEPFTQPQPAQGLPKEFGAAVFRKADRDLLGAWNRAMAGFIGSPEHLRMLARYGLGEEVLPGKATTSDILFSKRE